MRRILRVEHLVPVAGLVIFVLIFFGPQDPPCTLRTPCGPDVGSWVALGALLAPMIMVYVHRWAAAWAAVGCAVSWLLIDRYLDERMGWTVVLPWACAVVAVLVARRAADRVQQVSPRAPVPAPAALPRVGGGYLVLAAAAFVTAGALAGWVVWRQDTADRRQDSARIVAGVVPAQVGDDDTAAIDILLDDGSTHRSDVLDVDAYPIGTRVEAYTGAGGLWQLRSEPYDITPLFMLVVAAAGLGVALLVRAAQHRHDLRALFGTPQPVRAVRVADEYGYVHVLVPAADGRTAAEFGISVDESGPPPPEPDEDEEPRTEAALLYGEPRPGHWCAVQAGGRIRVPLAPVGDIVEVPYDAEHFLPQEVADDDAQLVDPAELTAADRDAAPGDVREHRVTAPRRWFEAVAIGAGVTVTTAQAVHLVEAWRGRPAIAVVAVVAALAYEFGWRTQLRPRLRWDVGGLAAVTFRHRERAVWTSDSAVVHDDDGTVIVTSGDVVVVIDAPKPWPSWAAQRTAGQLVAGLRDARRQALDTARAPAPPDLDEPGRPLLLYLAWAATVAVAVALTGW